MGDRAKKMAPNTEATKTALEGRLSLPAVNSSLIAKNIATEARLDVNAERTFAL